VGESWLSSDADLKQSINFVNQPDFLMQIIVLCSLPIFNGFIFSLSPNTSCVNIMCFLPTSRYVYNVAMHAN